MSKERSRVQVNIGSLEIGMFVCDLSIPWASTTYPLQGFTIKSEQDIFKLSQQCKYVFIDEELSSNNKKSAGFSVDERKEKLQKSFNTKFRQYNDSEKWEKEFPKAKKAINDLSDSIKSVFSEFAQTKAFNIEKMKSSIDPMIDSISRNPDACIWLARMKKENNYIYEHSLSSSIWAVALGRQLGLDKNDLKSLALGALLLDVGKLEIDPEILQVERKLTKEEFDNVKTHVHHSLNLVKDTKGLNKNILAMIAEHHERHNGEGYPQGLKADDIHVFARIGAIVDCYDAITSNRPYAKAISPSEAIKQLYQWRDDHFQAELIEEFIQAIGIYPAGSLVELSSGEVAIVLAEYRSRRLRPEVLLLLDKDKQPIKDSIIIKLYEMTHDSVGKKLDIISSLEPNAFGIKMDSIQL